MMKPSRGFTLIEAVMVIVITGIIGAMVSVFIVSPIKGYADSVRRAELTDAADVALRRLSRDVRRALPNSLRQTSATTFEMIATKSGGQYRDESDGSSGVGLKYLFLDTSFDVLGPLPSMDGGDFVVVYNLGEGYTPADAYAGGNVATISGSSAVSASPVALSSNPFPTQTPPLRSPNSRFQVVDKDEMVVRYVCTGGVLTRYSGCSMATPSVCSTGYPIAGSTAQTASCTINYSSAALGRAGLLYVSLTLTDVSSSESVTLFQQVHVDNSP